MGNSNSAMDEYSLETSYRNFPCQIFHNALSVILSSLKDGMTSLEVIKFSDGHFHQVIYGLGPYIADYEEQVLLACIVHGWCARWDVDTWIYQPVIDICLLNRCWADHNNLDEDALSCTREFNEEFNWLCTAQVLWNEFSIVADLVVRTFSCSRGSFMFSAHTGKIAIYEWLSQSWHPSNHCPGHFTSAHQRWIQRSSGWLIWEVHSSKSLEEGCKMHPQWYQSKVSLCIGVWLVRLTNLNTE